MKKNKQWQFTYNVHVEWRSASDIITPELFIVKVNADDKDSARRIVHTLLKENWGEAHYKWQVDIAVIQQVN